MRKQIVAVVIVVLGLAGSLAWAGNRVEATFKFDFIVGGKTMPAGDYVVQVEGERVTIKAAKGAAGTEVPVVTRLADRGLDKPKFFFDKTEDGKHYLAELQLPGMDGFAFQGAPGRHSHEAVSPGN